MILLILADQVRVLAILTASLAPPRLAMAVPAKIARTATTTKSSKSTGFELSSIERRQFYSYSRSKERAIFVYRERQSDAEDG